MFQNNKNWTALSAAIILRTYYGSHSKSCKIHSSQIHHPPFSAVLCRFGREQPIPVRTRAQDPFRHFGGVAIYGSAVFPVPRPNQAKILKSNNFPNCGDFYAHFPALVFIVLWKFRKLAYAFPLRWPTRSVLSSWPLTIMVSFRLGCSLDLLNQQRQAQRPCFYGQ